MSKKWPYPAIIAHRGGGIYAPENTLAAMRCGARYGFSMLEFDVKLSRDKQAILLHDDDVKRTSNGKKLAAQTDYLDLLNLDMGAWHSACYAGEPLPLLKSVAHFALANHIICNIEIKPCPGREKLTGKIVTEAVKKWFKHAHIAPLISSFSVEALEASYHVAPKLPRAFLCDRYDDHVKKILKKLNCVAVNPCEKSLSKNIITDIHKAGYKICAWTVNDAQRAKQLFAWGCDAIFTDELERIPPSTAA